MRSRLFILPEYAPHSGQRNLPNYPGLCGVISVCRVLLVGKSDCFESILCMQCFEWILHWDPMPSLIYWMDKQCLYLGLVIWGWMRLLNQCYALSNFDMRFISKECLVWALLEPTILWAMCVSALGLCGHLFCSPPYLRVLEWRFQSLLRMLCSELLALLRVDAVGPSCIVGINPSR